jgi:hypothetical protein
MIRRHIPLALVVLLAVPAWAAAQTPATPPSSANPYPANPYQMATPYTGTPYSSMHYPSSQYPTGQYPSSHYPSSPTTAGRPINPAEAAAQQQSGLSESDVRTLLQSHGYTRLNSVQADPGSTWVWQADAVKNGRPVRVGVDYRGQVLVISPQARRPCAAPGANFGIGGIGIGAGLSAADSCRQ